MTELEQWGCYLRAGTMSKGTVRNRLHYVGRALAEIDRTPGQITETDLVTWIGEHTEWSPSTRKSARASLRGFWSWRSRVIGGDNVADSLPSTPVPRALPRPADDADVMASLRKADARVQLMIELMAYGGLRRCEVCTVRGDEIQGEWLRVTGKGGHIRMVPLPPHLASRIRAYGPHFVFPGQIDGHLSAGRVGELVAEALPGRLTGHQLRHRFATVAYRGSHDIRAVQALLGHARIDTTMVYTAVDQDSVSAAAMTAWRLSA